MFEKFGFPIRRTFPTPQLSAELYFRTALVPSRDQAQAGIGVGPGIVGRVESMARIVKTPMGNGMVDFQVIYPNN